MRLALSILRPTICAKANPPSSRRSSSFAVRPMPTTRMRWASMPAGAKISMEVLDLPENPAARAAFVNAPFVRSSMPRAAGPKTGPSPASTTSVAPGGADSGANWMSRGGAIGWRLHVEWLLIRTSARPRGTVPGARRQAARWVQPDRFERKEQSDCATIVGRCRSASRALEPAERPCPWPFCPR